MEYRGYRATVTFDDELDIFHGAVIGTTSVISFEGSPSEELREAFAGAVDEYLSFCEEEGVAPDKPFSRERGPADVARPASRGHRVGPD